MYDEYSPWQWELAICYNISHHAQFLEDGLDLVQFGTGRERSQTSVVNLTWRLRSALRSLRLQFKEFGLSKLVVEASRWPYCALLKGIDEQMLTGPSTRSIDAAMNAHTYQIT